MKYRSSIPDFICDSYGATFRVANEKRCANICQYPYKGKKKKARRKANRKEQKDCNLGYSGHQGGREGEHNWTSSWWHKVRHEKRQPKADEKIVRIGNSCAIENMFDMFS